MLLQDKIAIVTGAGRGIGLATAKALARQGVRVLIADITKMAAEAAAEEVGKIGARDARGVACDVSNESDVIATVDLAIKHFGSFDILVNNAGVMIFKPLEAQTSEDWNRVLGVDLLGAF